MNHTSATNSNRSRPALVNRTNSDDLNDMVVVGGRRCIESTKIRRVLKGTKKSNTTKHQQQQQQQPVAAAAAAALQDVPSSCAHSGARRRRGVENQRTAMATLPTVSSDASCSSESDDSSHLNKNNDNNISNNNKSMISWEHGWLKDDSLTKTSVYYRCMKNRPITVLQAAVRGKLARIHFRKARIQQLEAEILDIQNMAARRIQTRVRWNQECQKRPLHVAARCIQARVRLLQGKQARAITPLQAVCRGWMARLQFKVLVLEHQLATIHANHERDIRGIQHIQKVEMRRVDSEYKVIAGKENKRQSKVLEATLEDIYALRRENRDLRHQNETMQKASIIMAKKNVQTMELTTLYQNNLKELQLHVPQFERDYEQISMVSDDYLERIQRYQEALEMRQEHMCFERKVTKCLIQTIDIMLKHIDDKCQDDVALKEAILDQARATLKGTTNNNNNKRETVCSSGSA